MTHRTLSRWFLIAFTALVVLGLAGCGGQAPASAWPGLAPDEGVVYLTATTKAVALNSADGTKKWEYEHKVSQPGLFGASTGSDLFHAKPALGNGVVYFGTDDGYLLALDTNSGQLKWEFLPPQIPSILPFIKEKSAPVYAGPAIAGKRVIFAGTGETVYAVDADTGKLAWQTPVGSRVWGTPLFANNTIYVGTLGHKLMALDADTGKPRWTFDKPQGALAGQPVLDGDTLYVGSFDSHLYAVDAASGSQRWVYNANNWVWDGPVVVSGTLYFGDISGNVYALEAATQKPVWTPFQAGGAIRMTPLYSDGTLYVGTDAGALYALDATTGKERWPQPFKVSKARFLTTPVLQNGLLLVAPLEVPTQLYGLDPTNGQTKWQFPTPSK